MCHEWKVHIVVGDAVHKNHISILKAAKIIQKKGFDNLFVFSGLDRGFKIYLDEFIKSNKMVLIK